jgi:hypothetical protein
LRVSVPKFGGHSKRITVPQDQTHDYVTAIIKVHARRVIVVTLDGEIIHHGDFHLSRTLR